MERQRNPFTRMTRNGDQLT